eukprot:jgi/Chrzof1/2345/Cz11g11220.t1
MATTTNAFDLLIGTGEQIAADKKKNKKSKAKPKASTDVGAPGDVTDSLVNLLVTDAPEDSGEVDVREGCAILEKSAKTCKTGTDRLKLWKDWMKQAGDKSPKAIKYRDSDGSLMDFKQLMMHSRALEITVEECMSYPLSWDNSSNLQQLFGTFLPRADAQVLATSVIRLAQLLAEDTQSYDTLGAAQRAVRDVIAALKVAKEEKGDTTGSRLTSTFNRLDKIDQEINRQQTFLQKIAQTGGSISRQQIESGQQLVKLQAEKLDLLMQGAGARSGQQVDGTLQNTIRSVQELKSVINNHLRAARAVEESSKGDSHSADAQSGQAVAALQREEAVLSQQAAQLNAQIRALEAQLASLHSEAAEVAERHARVQQRKQAALGALGAQSTGRRAAQSSSSQHYSEELAAADGLLQLVDPSHASNNSEQLASARQAGIDGVPQYLGLVRQLLSMNLSSLAEVPTKIMFYRQRLDRAQKLSALGGSGAKQTEDAGKLLADTLSHSDNSLQSSMDALEGVRRRFTEFSMAHPEVAGALMQHVQEIEELGMHIKAQYEVVRSAAEGAAPPLQPAANAAATAPRGQRQQQAALYAAAAAAGVVQPGANGAGGRHSGPPNGQSGFGSVGAAPPTTFGAAAAAPTQGFVAPAAVKGAPVSNGTVVQSTVMAATNKAAAAPVAEQPVDVASATMHPSDGFKPVGGKKNRRKA